MKKIIALLLSLIMMFSVCTPAMALNFREKEAFRLVVPKNWEMNIGDSRTVETIFPSDVKNRKLTWSTYPSEVASVDTWGRVTALQEGTVAVTAQTDDGLVDSVTLTVTSESTKMQKANKEKHNFSGEATKENVVLQKTVTRYAKTNSSDVPDYVKNELAYQDAKTTITADGAVWEITDYGVLRTDKNATNPRDVEQRFMGDRYFYSADTGNGNILAIFADDENGIWTVMSDGYTHIEMIPLNGVDKAALMSDNTQKHVSLRGTVSSSRYSKTLKKYIPLEEDNDCLWTSLYGAGELMRYAVLRDDPNATVEEVERARQTAVLSTEAVLFLTYVSMRKGTTESYVRAQRNGSVANLEPGKYFTSEALIEGGDYSQNIPGVSPADAFSRMNGIYKFTGIRSYIMDSDNLALFNTEDWADPSVKNDEQYAKRTRLLDGFWVRSYHLKDENKSPTSNIHWSHNGNGTATGVSTKKPTEDEYLLHGENLRGIITDASAEMPERLWNDIVGSNYDIGDVVYKGDTSTDGIIGYLFIFKLAYDILGEEDPEIKTLIRNSVEKFSQHLVDNSYSLCEANGQPTTWGKFNRAYLHNGQGLGSAPIQASILLSAFKLAAYVTGDQKWEDEYRMIALDPAYEYAEIMTQNWERYKMAILEYTASVSTIIPFFLRPFMETETMKTVYRMILHYSDEQMSMLAFYLLFQMEDDEELLSYYRKSLEDWWYSIRYSENPLWYYIYQLAYPNEIKTDPMFFFDLKTTVTFSLRVINFATQFDYPLYSLNLLMP